MDWNTLKALLKRWDGRCLIVEDGKPKYVLTTVEEYCGAGSETAKSSQLSDEELRERINRDIEVFKGRQRESEPRVELPEEGSAPLVSLELEDLPFETSSLDSR
ncbi:hypothetical protein HY442_00465 [Candidatus Parcubacteria bacterium]|nr:hypothetical protein [Candidatus Parcubacteria bacterium]MBI4385545.1 hypothetical protein [Candidatus Parcubacteria bacterium]